MNDKNDKNDKDAVARRANEAIRRALNTPPKPHKDMKKGNGGKKPKDKPTVFQKP